MPQTLASVAADMTSFAAENGVCTSHRRPPVSVSVGVTFHESCRNAPNTLIWPARTRGPNATYLFVSASSAAWPVRLMTRPVSSAYRSRASASWPDDAPGKVRGGEQADRRIEQRAHAEVGARHHLLAELLGRGQQVGPAEADAVRPPLPGHRVLDAVGGRRSPRRGVAHPPVGEADVRIEIDGVPVLVRVALRAVGRRVAEAARRRRTPSCRRAAR